MYIKNIEQGKVFNIKTILNYEERKIASMTLVQRKDLGITLFAFDSEEGVGTHASEGDAMVVVLEGTADVTIDGVITRVSEGEMIVLPANIPHAVKAITKYKMLLTVVKAEKE